MRVSLICADAATWDGRADLVLTNPYGPLPACLRGVPALISDFAYRKDIAETRAHARLREVCAWGRQLRNRVWCAWLFDHPIDLTDLVEDEFEPGRGWFPLELPLRLLRVYARPGMTVIDPFMGRGTVGKACQQLGLDFVGIDIDPARVALARDYLGVG